MIVLLFFSISGAVILKMFATAEILAEKSDINERSVLYAQSLSEVYTTHGDMNKAVSTVFGENAARYDSEGSCTVSLDNNMHPLVTASGINEFEAVRLVMSEERTEGGCGSLHTLTVTIYTTAENTDDRYTLVCSAYIPDYDERNTRND